MTDLESLSIRFKEWKGNQHHVRYPKSLWIEIEQLSKHYPIKTIGQACGINPYYLRSRIFHRQKSLEFAEVQLVSAPSQASIEFADNNSRPITIRFQADQSQLVQMIRSLQATS
jgi:hypothetical protein